VSTLRRILLAGAGGVVLNLAHPDASWWPLALVSLGMLWWALDGITARAGFALGWLFGVAFLAPHVWWAYMAVGPVPWVALFVVEGLAFALFAASWVHVERSGLLAERWWAQAPTFALLWVGWEQVRSMVPFGGFPWGRVAFSQLDAPVAHLAWVGGAPLVSFVTVCAAVLLAGALVAIRERLPLHAAAGPFVAVVLLLIGFAVPLDNRAETGTIQLGIVQGNLPNLGLEAFAQAREVTDNHLAGTEELVEWAPDMDLLVWPENSADFDPRTDERSYDTVTAAARLAQAPLLMGANDYSAEGGRYNAGLLWSPDGGVLDQYNKQQPAPFAEYIPFREVARMFSEAVDLVHTDVVPGDEPGVIDVDVDRLERDVAVGVVICFEVAYDPVVRESAAEGAEVLIVQTNNANFGETAESTQQLSMSRLRAIETGRATIQASTVGVSAVIAPDGRILDSTGLFTAEQMYAAVPLRDTLTPAVKYGQWWEWGFVVLPALVLGRALMLRWQERYEW